MRTELQRRRRPLTWVAPAGEAEEVSASRAPHARRSALHPAAWHGQQRRPRPAREGAGGGVAGPPTARGQRVCISGVSSQPPGSLWRRGRQGEEQVGPKAEVAHAALGPRCREGLRAGKGVRSTTSSPRRAKQTNHLPPPPRRLHGAPAAPRQRRALSAGLRGPGRRAHAPHPRGRGQRHNVSSWCVRKMTPEKVSRGRARDRESGAGPSRERTRRPPWRREPGPDRSPAAWGPAFRPPHSSEGAFLWGPGPAARWMSAVRPARVLSPARR